MKDIVHREYLHTSLLFSTFWHLQDASVLFTAREAAIAASCSCRACYTRIFPFNLHAVPRARIPLPLASAACRPPPSFHPSSI